MLFRDLWDGSIADRWELLPRDVASKKVIGLELVILVLLLFVVEGEGHYILSTSCYEDVLDITHVVVSCVN